MVTTAPAIRTRRKAHYSESGEANAILRAMGMLWSTPVWVPVCYGGRIVGEVRGDYHNRRSFFHPYEATGVPYKNYDDAVNAKTQEFRWAGYWLKMFPNGVANNWYDLWPTDGVPSKGDYSGTAKTARQFTKSTTGAMYSGPDVSTKVKYLTRFTKMTPEGANEGVMLYDRVLSYDACTMSASNQAMTNTLAATRYISSGDPGLQLFISADAVHSATTGNLTVCHYTNDSGTTGRSVTTTPTLALVTSTAAPTNVLGARGTIQSPGITTQNLLHIPLAAGDLGIRKIEDFTFSSAPTGTNCFMLHFPIMLCISEGNATANIVDYSFVGGIEGIAKRIYDDACLSVMVGLRTGVSGHTHGLMEVGWN